MGQECLKLQEKMRGGLLGAGHTWLGSPADTTSGEGSEAAAAAPAPAPAVEEGPGRLALLADRLYNVKEDVLDALDEPLLTLRAPSGAVAVRASGGALVNGMGGTALAAVLFMYLQQLLPLLFQRLQ